MSFLERVCRLFLPPAVGVNLPPFASVSMQHKRQLKFFIAQQAMASFCATNCVLQPLTLSLPLSLSLSFLPSPSFTNMYNNGSYAWPPSSYVPLFSFLSSLTRLTVAMQLPYLPTASLPNLLHFSMGWQGSFNTLFFVLFCHDTLPRYGFDPTCTVSLSPPEREIFIKLHPSTT